MISVLFTALLSLMTSAFGGAQSQGDDPVVTKVGEPAVVVVGSGEVRPAVIEEVRGLVGHGLQVLRPVFPKLQVLPFLVSIHESRASMPESLVRRLHLGSAGFALLGQHQIHLVWGEMRRYGTDPGGVVTHELVHELLDQFTAPNGQRIPRWFHEGLAQLLAGDTYLGAREEDLIWRLAAGRMSSFESLRDGFPLDPDELQAAYAQSYSYVAWLAREFGVPALLEVAKGVDDTTTLERSLVFVTQRTTLQLGDAWRYHLSHESGASWRLMLNQCFNLLLIASVPLLIVAVIRRFARERRAAERLMRTEHEPSIAYGQDPFAGELQGPPLPEGFDERTP